MSTALPDSALETLDWPWERWQPAYRALIEAPLAADSVEGWLARWTGLTNLINETGARLSVAANIDTADKQAEARFHADDQQIQRVGQRQADPVLPAPGHPAEGHVGQQVAQRRAGQGHQHAAAAQERARHQPAEQQRHPMSSRNAPILHPPH